MLGKIKYVLKKNLNMKTSYVVGLTVLSLFIIVGGLSVALYTSQAESRGSLNIMTGDLISLLEGEELTDNQIRVEGNETKRITITLKNKNNKDAKFNLYYTPIEGVEIRSYSGLKPPTEEGIVLKPEEEKTYKVEIHNTKGEAQQITFGSDVGLSTKNLSFPSGRKIIEIGNDPNSDANSLYNIVKTQTKGTDENIDFTKNIPIDSGVYTKHETTLDTYPVYYYRGKVDNNLIFANFCWKIVRTTETGGIKLIYNGTPTENRCNNYDKTESFINASLAFNKEYRSPAYIGYMHGNAYEIQIRDNISAKYGNDVEWNGKEYVLKDIYEGNDYLKIADKHHYTCFTDATNCERVNYVFYIASNQTAYVILENGVKIEDAMDEMFSSKIDSDIKIEIDNWYKTNLDVKGYTEKLEDTIWCNDRTVSRVWSLTNGWEKDGDATKPIYFESYGRIYTNELSFNCPNVRDSFTVNKENGNGALIYPVGLLTADEATLAGNGMANFSSDSYLYTNSAWRNMTPTYGFNAAITYIDTTGKLAWNDVWAPQGVRPAISLKLGTMKASGSGTTEDPYIIN